MTAIQYHFPFFFCADKVISLISFLFISSLCPLLNQNIFQEYLILIDEVNELGAVGRSYMDAPEVDGKVYLSDDFDAKPGDLIWVQIIHADELDVWGVRVEE